MRADRQTLYALLGDLPPREGVPAAEVAARDERPRYTVETLRLDLNGLQTVPAYFLLPKNRTAKAPAVIFNHWHDGDYRLGKDDLFRSGDSLSSWADTLTGLGSAVLCIDHWCFGERAGRGELDTFKEMLWRGRVQWGMMVFDSLRAFDYLRARPEIDEQRIGTLGMSMGSTMAWWLAALEEGIKVCADICCLTDFETLIEFDNLSGHGIYYYVPGLLKHFSAAQINAMIAPRAHIAVAGLRDPLTPPAGLDRIDRALRSVYREQGAPDHWMLRRYDVGHVETPAMRHDVVTFLKEHL